MKPKEYQMKKDEVLEIAHYIFTAGKLVHDRIYEAGACYFNDEDGSGAVVELSLPQKNLMMTIRRQGAVTMSDLANQLGVSPPSASAMVDRLVEKNILTRTHSTEDRRKVVVRISDEAMSMMDGIEKNMLGFFIELVEKIGPKTAKKWCQVLERVESVLDSE